MPRIDLGVAERDSGGQGVGDRRMTQRVRAHAPVNACCFRDPLGEPEEPADACLIVLVEDGIWPAPCKPRM